MSNKKKILNVFMFLFYFVYQIIPLSIVKLLNISITTNIQKSIYLIVSSLLYLLFVIFVYRKELYDDIKKYNLKNTVKYLPIYLLGIFLMGLSSYILRDVTNMDIPENESLVRQYIKLFPIYMCFSTVIYAPIVEEITFRKTFRNLIKDNILFIIVSGFIFGIIHIKVTDGSINDLLMILPYIIMGIDFSYIYSKSNNIFTTITFHSIHNLILLIIQFMIG